MILCTTIGIHSSDILYSKAAIRCHDIFFLQFLIVVSLFLFRILFLFITISFWNFFLPFLVTIGKLLLLQYFGGGLTLGYCYYNQFPSLLLSGSGFFFLSGFSFSFISCIFLPEFSLFFTACILSGFSFSFTLVSFYRDIILLLPVVSFCQELYCKRYSFIAGWVSFFVAFFYHSSVELYLIIKR